MVANLCLYQDIWHGIIKVNSVTVRWAINSADNNYIPFIHYLHKHTLYMILYNIELLELCIY